MTLGFGFLCHAPSLSAALQHAIEPVKSSTARPAGGTPYPNKPDLPDDPRSVDLVKPVRKPDAADIPCLEGAAASATGNGPGHDIQCDAHADDGFERALVTRLGRRAGKRDGIMGEIDGLNIGYRLGNGMALTGVAGFPVLSGNDLFNTSRQMYGMNAQWDKPAKQWMLNSYYVELYQEGTLRAQTLGTAFRYSRPGQAILLHFDYDLRAGSAVGITASGFWRLDRHTTISAALDLRRGPMRQYQRNYLSSTLAASEDWTWVLPDKHISKLANTNPDGVSGMAVAIGHAFSDRIKLNGSFYVLSALDRDHAQVPSGAAPFASEYFYRLKLSASNWFEAADQGNLEFCRKITESTTRSTASFDAKYSIGRFWNIRPKLHAEITHDLERHKQRKMAAPSVRIEYKPASEYGIQFEAGGEWKHETSSAVTTVSSNYAVKLSYKASF